MRYFQIILFILSFFSSIAQQGIIPGNVSDSKTRERLSGVSILVFGPSGFSGTISNREGEFRLINSQSIDSIKFSMIGYRILVLHNEGLLRKSPLEIKLEQETENLSVVNIHPIPVLDIIHKAIERLKSVIPKNNFENTAFYREIIRDTLQYYSVSEAVFKTQYTPEKKSFKLELLKGRSREDVTYTRLFEDFHPGGGPEEAINLNFVAGAPDFLNESKLKYFDFKMEPPVQFENQTLYIIRFDQKPGIKEALETGEIYIDADDYTVLKYECKTSPYGIPYIKSLKGTDKIFAELLHIDLQLRGWSKTAIFRKTEGMVYLEYANLIYDIGYKQPKKGLNLNLDIQSEFLATDLPHKIQKDIRNEKEWHRKDLVANLPNDFDPAFWGSNIILTPTKENLEMMDEIMKRNHEEKPGSSPEGWKYINKEYFIATEGKDSMKMVALKKCNWKDNETGAMIYREFKGDFSIETKLVIHKSSNSLQTPENGFQQAGIIIKSPDTNSENYLISSLGIGGNEKPKYFLNRTAESKSKIQVDKTDSLTSWLKLVRQGNIILIYRKSREQDTWVKTGDCRPGWLQQNMQAGFSIMSRFAGDGPKQHPDLKAVFSNILIEYR